MGRSSCERTGEVAVELSGVSKDDPSPEGRDAVATSEARWHRQMSGQAEGGAKQMSKLTVAIDEHIRLRRELTSAWDRLRAAKQEVKEAEDAKDYLLRRVEHAEAKVKELDKAPPRKRK
jgi:hypothetical protein